MAGRVVDIFLATDAGDPPTRVESAELTATGLVGDRYERGVGTFSNRLPDGRAITLIASEDLAHVHPPADHGEHRRNIVTSGVDLLALVHVKFRVGEVVLRGNRSCPPCGRLSKLIGADAKAIYHKRGGLRADVIEPGLIRAGDSVEVLA